MDCQACGHRFANVLGGEEHIDKVYSDSYFTEGNAGYSGYTLDKDLLIKRGRKYAQILQKHVPDKGRLLDVGAAAGFILKGFTEEGWDGIGLEPNQTMASYGIEELGLDMRTGTLESTVLNERFDLITMAQVVAHFYDPISAFENACSLLKPKGYLFIETWDRDSFSARLFGKHWHEYSPPSVLHWFSRDSLSDILAKIGFEEVAKGRMVKRLSGRHIRSLLSYRLGTEKLFRLIPDRITLPYPSEDLFWALYRKKD